MVRAVATRAVPRRVLRLLMGAAVVLGAARLSAQEALEGADPDPHKTADSVPGSDEAVQTGDEDEPSFRWTRVRLNGRLVGSWQSVRQDDVSASEFDVDNARLTLRWRPARWLRGELEYDAAMNRKLKDAFLLVRTDTLSFRAGQFKPPFSVVAMDSRWDLPLSERSQLDMVLRDSLGVIGRRPGFQGGYQPRGGNTQAYLGVFQSSSVRGDRIGSDGFDNFSGGWAPKITGRAQHQRRPLALGVNADWRSAEPVPGGGEQHFWTLGADIAFLQGRKSGGWRLWGEGFVGSSWQDSNPFDGIDSTFVAGQVIGAWRYGGRKRRAFYVEPYTLVSLFDPDTSIRNDLLWEAAGGVNVGRWDQLRFTVEVQSRHAGANAPPSLGLVFVDAPPFSRTRLVLQIGGVF